jgi:Family of unknown function (DUF5906)/RepB DNA-primase N-terminal domain
VATGLDVGGRFNAANKRGIYVAIQDIRGRRKIENVTRIRAVFAELDDGLPAKWPLAPSMVVESSPGKFHVYWLVDADRGTLSVDDFQGIEQRLVQDYKADDAARDAARILRVPGFWNWKYTEPFQVQLIEAPGHRYSREELIAAFPPIAKRPKGTAKTVQGIIATALSADQFVTFDSRYVQSAIERECTRVTAAQPGAQEKTLNEASFGLGALLKANQLGEHATEVVERLVAAGAKMKDGRDAHGNPRPRWTEAELREKAWRGVNDGLINGERDPTAAGGGRVQQIKSALATAPPDGKTAIEFGIEVMTSGASPWTKEMVAELLTRMNREHAVVLYGGSVRYLHDSARPNGQSELRFLRPDDMAALYDNIRIPNEVVSIPRAGSTSAFVLWKRWPLRRQFNGVGMYPNGAVVPKGYLNLWTGFAVKPIEGDWSLFRDHIKNIICGGDDEIFAWVLDWMADSVQNPHQKPGSAIVLKSSVKGTGKTMLNTFIRRIFGVHAITVSQSEHLVGRFNGHLLRALFVGVEEAFWAGNKAATGALKSLITEADITIERKGVDAVTLPNFSRLIFTSNEKWVVPVGVDERRFEVLEVNNPDANKPEYFDPIFRQMEKDGGLEAMLHELLNRKITSNLRRPPETKALIDQRAHSLEALERWVWTVARNGEFADPDDRGSVVGIEDDADTEVPCATAIAAAKASSGRYDGRFVDTELGPLLEKFGVRKKREGGGKRRSMYVFPPLGLFRQAVEKHLKVPCFPDEQSRAEHVRSSRIFGSGEVRRRDKAVFTEAPVRREQRAQQRAQLDGLANRLARIAPARASRTDRGMA